MIRKSAFVSKQAYNGRVGNRKGAEQMDLFSSSTLSELRLTRRDVNMIRLKSALYNMTAGELIREAVKAYQGEIPSLDNCVSSGVFCDGAMEVIHLPHVVPIKIGNQETDIVITDVPAYRCKKCGDIQRDVELIATIEEVLDDQVKEWLGNQEPFPQSISLHDLMQAE